MLGLEPTLVPALVKGDFLLLGLDKAANCFRVEIVFLKLIFGNPSCANVKWVRRGARDRDGGNERSDLS